jgi:hypothetical protein
MHERLIRAAAGEAFFVRMAEVRRRMSFVVGRRSSSMGGCVGRLRRAVETAVGTATKSACA